MYPKCWGCKYYEPYPVLNEDLDQVSGEFEDYGECTNRNHLIGDPDNYGFDRHECAPVDGGFIASNGFYESMESTLFFVSKNFGCINHKNK